MEPKDDSPRFEPIDRQQVVLEPLDVELLIPPAHPARNIWDLLGGMDLTRFSAGIKSVKGRAGRNAWDPRLLIAIWIYAYSRGISSAREIERQCSYEPALRWLTGLKVVNHHTLSDFRVEHGEALQNLFVQVLAMLAMKKLITLERVTVDGTKVRANVNKKTFSRGHKIREHLKLARRHVEELQKHEAEQEKRGRAAAAQRRAACEREERLKEALAEVEQLQREKRYEKDKPCQASTTDPDAQFMRVSDNGVAPAYNVQIATDGCHKLIVDVHASKQPSDSFHLLPALDRLNERFGRFPQQAVADGDYTKREAIVGAAERGVDYYGSWAERTAIRMKHGIDESYHASAFKYDETLNVLVCPEGRHLELQTVQKLSGGLRNHVFTAKREDCRNCPKRALCTPQNAMEKHGRAVGIRVEPEPMQRYYSKMATDAGKAIYRLRAAVAEFPHAWLKDKLKWVRVKCRGIVKVQAEALWVCLTYNLQRYFKLRQLGVA